MTEVINTYSITASRVSPDQENQFMAQLLGEDFSIPVRKKILCWLDELSIDCTNDGSWEIVKLSNGGFYMVPVEEDTDMFSVCRPILHFHRDFSADALGIMATMLALEELAHGCACLTVEKTTDLYRYLYAYTTFHPESDFIFEAVRPR